MSSSVGRTSSSWAPVRRRIWELVSVARPGDRASVAVDLGIVGLILANVVVVVVGTVPEVDAAYGTWLHRFETFSVVVFTLEYLARIATCTVDPRYARPILGRLRFARTPMAVIDLLAVVPFYLPLFGISLFGGDLRVLRALRLWRIVRVAKLGRYLPAFLSLNRVVVRKKEELVLSFSILAILLVLAASLMFYAEHDAQPQVFSSIPSTMWWAVATLTTVGYGDVYPVTAIGKILASVVSILGIGLFALPAGILASGLQEEWAELREETSGTLSPALQRGRRARSAEEDPERCPCCGQPVPDEG